MSTVSSIETARSCVEEALSQGQEVEAVARCRNTMNGQEQFVVCWKHADVQALTSSDFVDQDSIEFIYSQQGGWLEAPIKPAPRQWRGTSLNLGTGPIWIIRF